jgi:hypothetical protein
MVVELSPTLMEGSPAKTAKNKYSFWGANIEIFCHQDAHSFVTHGL